MTTVPTPTTALGLDEINPASFDFWLRDDVEGALAKLRHERPVDPGADRAREDDDVPPHRGAHETVTVPSMSRRWRVQT